MLVKNIIATALLSVLTASALAADAKEDVTKAAKALADKGNYSWKTTTEVPEGTRFRPGPTEGKADKAGHIHLTMTFGENTTHAVVKGDKAVYTNQDGDWQEAGEAGQGRGGFMARTLRNYKAPAKQAPEILASVKDLKKEGDAYVGDLTEEGAKTLMSLRGGRTTDGGPEIRGAKGSAKFWVKDGVLTKYQYQVIGQMTFNNNDIDMDRTTVIEIKDIGTATVNIPEEARKKLG